MKKWMFLLLLLAACTKETIDQRVAQLLVESNGFYSITYGTSKHVTVQCEDNWSTSMNVNAGDTIQLAIKTEQSAATLYMRIEMREGILYCKSLYIKSNSVGILNYIVEP